MSDHQATPEQWAKLEYFNSATSACILELRARSQLLEATQHAHIEAVTHAPVPAGSLVERVAAAIADNDAPVDLWHDDARAAIREVAAAALQMHPDKNLTWERVALWLEQEAGQPTSQEDYE